MKKLICFLIIFSIIINIIPALADSELTDVVASVCSKIDIPEHFDEFNSNINVDVDNKKYYLSWSGNGDEMKSGGFISVTADNRGRIFNYSYYEYGNFEGDYKLSKIDYNDAVLIAHKAINKICPEFAKSMVPFIQTNYITRNDRYYTIVFYRYENGIPYYKNGISVDVNGKDGSIQNINVFWNDINKFPKPGKVISEDEARQAFMNKIGITLGYRSNANGETYLQYSTNQNGSNFIDPLTGDVFNTNIQKDSEYSPNTNFYEKRYCYPNNIFITEEEYYGQSGILSDETAEQYVRSCAEFGINSAYTLIDKRYSKNPLNEPLIELIFAIGNKDKIDGVSYGGDIIEITLNTKTNEIMHFQSIKMDDRQSIPVTEKVALSNAEDFISKYASSKYTSCTLLQIQYDKYNYNFIYNRMVNSLPYYDNGIRISVEKKTGKVQNMDVYWSNTTFPSAKDSISKEKAFDTLFQNSPLTLQYVAVNKSRDSNLQQNNIDMKLAYSFGMGKPIFISTEGRQVYQDNSIYKKDFIFEDIMGHYSESSIKILANCGILPQDDKFYPDELISQGDFLLWANNAIGSGKYDGNIDLLYNDLINKEILTKEEASPESTITMETAAKYFISMIGYKEVAEMPDTYQTLFVDEGNINPELIGYAAIAQGMKIIQGNAFLPKSALTRAVAAEIIYNYLSN